MEQTMARAIYKAMKIGEKYTSYELYKLVEDEYPATGEDVRKVVSREMWKVVNAGYAKTFKKTESLPIVRAIRYGSAPTSYQTYTIRYWIRTK